MSELTLEYFFEGDDSLPFHIADFDAEEWFADAVVEEDLFYRWRAELFQFGHDLVGGHILSF